MRPKTEKFDKLFYPRSVAVIGASATPGKWGFGVLHNVIQGGFQGEIYPINPKSAEIFASKAYPSISDVPGPVDLAMIVVPPEKVIPAIEQCGKKKVAAAVIITAGFAEVGQQERGLQEELARAIDRTGMLVIGPNCQGIMCTQSKLYAQFIWIFPNPGCISIVSQSGNVGGSLIGRGMAYGIGFSKFVSSGNEAHTHCWDIIDYYGQDPDTKVIAAYIEGVPDGKAFLDAAARVTRKKPIVAVKAGVTAAGSKACSSHTGVMAGEEAIFEASCRQAGVTLVRDLEELFYVSATMAAQPLPSGNRVGILTWGGGWGVMGADTCAQEGLDVAALPKDMIDQLNRMLPSRWSHNNPIDMAAGGQDNVLKILEILIKSEAYDSVIQLGMGVSQFLQAMVNNSFYFSHPDRKEIMDKMIEGGIQRDKHYCTRLMELIEESGKPLLPASDTAASPSDDNIAWQTLRQKGIIIYPTPAHAAMALGHLTRYAVFRRAIENDK